MTRIVLRAAGAGDGTFLWNLRNDPEVRRQSRTSEPIEWDEHARWLDGRLRDIDNTRLYVAEVDGAPCGQVRVDRRGELLGEISIALVSDIRAKGVGTRLIVVGSKRGAGDLRLTELIAVIKRTNVASLGAFARAGYCNDGPAADLADGIQMRLTLPAPS